MLTKKINLEGVDLETLRAEHESALLKMNQPTKNEIWRKKKKGMFSSSDAIRLMGYEDKDIFPDGAITYVTEKILELITEDSDEPQLNTKSVNHGKDTEVEAMIEFMKKYDVVVYNYGDDQEFIMLGLHSGCTPDGLISTDGGAETKCPDSKTHLYYLENLTAQNFKELCTKYYWQIQSSMYKTGRKYWWFISYDPRFKNKEKRLFAIKIDRNDNDIKKYEKRLTEAIKRKIQRLKAYGYT